MNTLNRSSLDHVRVRPEDIDAYEVVRQKGKKIPKIWVYSSTGIHRFVSTKRHATNPIKSFFRALYLVVKHLVRKGDVK